MLVCKSVYTSRYNKLSYLILSTDINRRECLEPITRIITPQGGVIESQYCKLEFPPSSVRKDTVITVAVLDHVNREPVEVEVGVSSISG